jgi:hypothetical protein
MDESAIIISSSAVARAGKNTNHGHGRQMKESSIKYKVLLSEV